MLRKDQLIDHCRKSGITSEGYTVEFLRKQLIEHIRMKRMRTSTENLFKDLEDEVKTSEKSVVHEDAFTILAPPMTTTSRNSSPKPVRIEISEAKIMSTSLVIITSNCTTN